MCVCVCVCVQARRLGGSNELPRCLKRSTWWHFGPLTNWYVWTVAYVVHLRRKRTPPAQNQPTGLVCVCLFRAIWLIASPDVNENKRVAETILLIFFIKRFLWISLFILTAAEYRKTLRQEMDAIVQQFYKRMHTVYADLAEKHRRERRKLQLKPQRPPTPELRLESLSQESLQAEA